MKTPWEEEIPEEWDTIPLKYLMDIRTGGTPSRSKDNFWDGKIPWVSSKDMVSKNIGDAEEYISHDAVEQSSAELVPKGSLLIVSRSGILEHTIPVAVTTDKVAINQDIRAYIPREDIISSKYICNVITGFEQPLLEMWKQQGATVQSLNSVAVAETKFPVPSKQQQNLITDFCSENSIYISSAIDAADSLKEALKQRRIAKIWEEVTHSGSKNSGRKETNLPWLGTIPNDWMVTKIGWIYDIQLGKMLDESEISGDDLAPYLRNKDVQWWSINTDNLPEMDFSESEQSKYQLKNGDVLVCEGGEAGRSAVWREDDDEIFYQKALHRVRPTNSDQVPEFFCYFMEFAVKEGLFSSRANQSTIEHVTVEKLSNQKIPVPPLSEQEEIVQELSECIGEIESSLEDLNKIQDLLKEKRQALITKAVTDQIDLSDWQPPDKQEATP
ncbi:restriction endonuclease subunit S [Haloarcula nitratireducens]|uniref:Restriction endonuclease subunit S n=1 Tax=Haloarcula nitratireducens TaxID=2487749 RepID=A0AAW4PHT1_9EURY|nr:restriction endonuclease subunit S [Halomicroarcula nitratireducens]MBX0296995.1 restriction endonuclease subunit S [Halomicroarcula nitratireducens]